MQSHLHLGTPGALIACKPPFRDDSTTQPDSVLKCSCTVPVPVLGPPCHLPQILALLDCATGLQGLRRLSLSEVVLYDAHLAAMGRLTQLRALTLAQVWLQMGLRTMDSGVVHSLHSCSALFSPHHCPRCCCMRACIAGTRVIALQSGMLT